MDGSLACTIRTLLERRASKRVGNVNNMQRDGSHFTRKGGMQECMEGQAGGVACGNRADTANGGTLLIMNAVFQWDHTSSLPPKDSRSGWSAKHQAPSTKPRGGGEGGVR